MNLWAGYFSRRPRGTEGLAQGHITGWWQNEDPTRMSRLLTQEYKNSRKMLTAHGDTTCLLISARETLYIFMIHLRAA